MLSNKVDYLQEPSCRGVDMSTLTNIPEIFCFQTKAYYTNGVITSGPEAQLHIEALEKIANGEVELHHNNTTPPEKIAVMSAKILLGTIGITFALCSEKKRLNTAVAVASLALVMWGLYDYYEIQQLKNESATNLAVKVIGYLETNPLSHVTLIFHSQGADIGGRTLLNLAAFKTRIHVITIGGMITIPNDFANRVVNFQSFDDFISKSANAIFDTTIRERTRIGIKNAECKTLLCHGANDYLDSPAVQSTIGEFTLPNCYTFR